MNGIKRFAAAILCLLLCATAFGALAEGLTAGPVPVYLDQKKIVQSTCVGLYPGHQFC